MQAKKINMVTPKIIGLLAALLGILPLSYFFIDIPLALFCQALDQGVRDVFEIITRFGVSTWYLVSSFLLFLYFRFFRKNQRCADLALYIFLSIAISGILANVVKVGAGRWRPKMFFEQGFYGFAPFHFGYEQTSFPSGHAATVFSLAAALAVYFRRWRWFLFFMAVGVGASRMILGAHYFSDVVAGGLLGGGTAWWLHGRVFPSLGDGRGR